MNPYTMEGIPARSSTAVLMMEANAPLRKYSPIRMARARERTVAITSAMREVMSVPNTNGSAWKLFVTGSHSEPVRKRKPLVMRAGREETTRERRIAMSRMLTAIPPKKRIVRNAESDARAVLILIPSHP